MFTLDTPQGDAERDHLAYASPGLLEFLALNRKMSNVGPEAVRDLVMAADAAAMVVADTCRRPASAFSPGATP